MKYIYVDGNGTEQMEIDTDGKRVVGVSWLSAPNNDDELMSAEDLQRSLDLYLRRKGATLEDALAAYAGGYGAFTKVEED